MTNPRTLEVPIDGMDCLECTQHVQHAIAALPGVEQVQVFLAAEKAVIQLDPEQIDLPAIRQAVQEAGYSVPPDFSQPQADQEVSSAASLQDFSRPVLALF